MTGVTAADTGLETTDLQKRFKYHHGNLRESLIDAALDILKTEGVAGLSLRHLAKVTGVTPAAPYSHFRDKDDLLATIAESGFQKLALQMVEDATGVHTTQARVEKLITSYIRFAENNTPLFRLMFGAEVSDMKKYPTLAMTAGKSYALISSALSARTPSDMVDTRFLTVTIWSLCHGLASLVIDERLNPAAFGAASLDAFVQKTVGAFSQHLA